MYNIGKGKKKNKEKTYVGKKRNRIILCARRGKEQNNNINIRGVRVCTLLFPGRCIPLGSSARRRRSGVFYCSDFIRTGPGVFKNRKTVIILRARRIHAYLKPKRFLFMRRDRRTGRIEKKFLKKKKRVRSNYKFRLPTRCGVGIPLTFTPIMSSRRGTTPDHLISPVRALFTRKYYKYYRREKKKRLCTIGFRIFGTNRSRSPVAVRTI